MTTQNIIKDFFINKLREKEWISGGKIIYYGNPLRMAVYICHQIQN
jgi:hypothetical protein